MKNFNKYIWGLLFIIIGVVVLLNSLGVATINLFFDGWWTLFIIVPSIIGLINDEDKSGNIVGLLIGILLFLSARDILDFGMLLKLIFPLVLITIGICIIFKETIKSKISRKVNEKTDGLENIVATFSNQKIKIEKKFDGSIIDAIFGGVTLDLREATLDNETIIKANAIFGSVAIKLPKNVSVELKSTPIFGSVNNSYKNDKESKKIVYIDSLALFGGVDIK